MISISSIRKRMRPLAWAMLFLYSAVLSLSVIASNHIVIAGGEYSTWEVNRISPYGYGDLALFAFAFILCFTIGMLVLASLFPTPEACEGKSPSLEVARLNRKPILLMSVVLFALYLPYLLAYWPGLIFGDSVSSLSQSLGFSDYSNHHPLAFTLCVKACLFVAHMLGLSNSAGCALFTIIQMVALSLCFATTVQWVMQRTGCHRIWRFVLLAFFGIPPYFATYTIAMWKDPLFSAAVLMLTLLIFDLVASKGRVLQTEKAWLPVFALSCLVACLFRSNGILVVILLAVVLAAMALRCRSAYKKPAAIGAATAIAAMLLTGPVFNALGVTPAAKAEGIGIPLNQMGRVAATGGIISDGDERYLNELLPLELYETVYTPTCVDSVKWNPEFNEEALSDDFWRHWLSMGIKNPVTYLESWELQTVGYWSINQPQALSHNRNIAAGVPRNSQDPVSLEAWEIYPQNKLGNDAVHSLLCTDQGFVPIGWLSWFALFAAIALFNCKKSAWFVSLVPTTAIIAALLVASPIWYWERYAVALQFLLPFYVVMLYCTGSVRRRPVPIEQRARLSKIFASPKTRTV